MEIIENNDDIGYSYIVESIKIDSTIKIEIEPVITFSRKEFDSLSQFIDWNRFSSSDLSNTSEYFLTFVSDKLNWDLLCENETVSEAFFIEHNNKINWVSMCKNRKMSEYFFGRYHDKLCWETLRKNESVSKSFFKKYSFPKEKPKV